ncbi:hypothetical protein glysoja_039860 [Glycine soja]|uniref:Uncharacterized protein n=1 Tax=Glycine soja TaxID=3848 RepID=A0A0B2PF12_GLYSO|nr:hypothetical protein glysoja_039860 [Glycine soja]
MEPCSLSPLKHQNSAMNTTLLHSLSIGTYNQLHKSILNKFLPDPANERQLSTTTSKQSRIYSIINKLGRKADNFSQEVREHEIN